MRLIVLCKHTTRMSAMLMAAAPGGNLIDFGVRRPAAALLHMNTKSRSQFVLVRYNKATAGRRTPKLVLVALLVLTSCHHQPAAPQNAQATPTPTVGTQSFPQRVGVINDFANAFNPSQKKNLESAITQLKNDSDVEFVVVTIDSTNGQPLFDYSLA